LDDALTGKKRRLTWHLELPKRILGRESVTL
jgi:hypothetical protein